MKATLHSAVLDPCSGSRMFHFDKNNPDVTFGDIRRESHTLCDGRLLDIAPDINLDFRDMPFANESFYHVVFDPPHLIHAGDKSWLALKYGKLEENWKNDLAKGFTECWRVLKVGGTLVFKWNEDQIKVGEILALTPHKPVYGHKSGKRAGTHWIVFVKIK